MPLPLGTEREGYLKAVEQVTEAIRAFAPDFFVLAAGYDTHRDDPIGGLKLVEEDYREIGSRLGRLGLPTVVVQEGGYNTDVLGHCVLALLQGFMSAR